MKKLLPIAFWLFSLSLVFVTHSLLAQRVTRDQYNTIWELMERKDLRLEDIDRQAEEYFNQVGKERGTGYKQYQRWKYEQQFHLDSKGYILPDDFDKKNYVASLSETPTQPAAIDSWSWTELGPSSWNRTSGWNPGVGRITSIAVSPVNPNIIYITSPGGGVWKTTQGGGQWIPLAEYDNSMMSTYAVAVHPTNPNLVIVGKTNGQIAKSIDGGSSWNAYNCPVGVVYKILFNKDNPDNIFVVGSAGICRSTDGGDTFTLRSSTRAEDIEFQPGSTGVMIASGSVIQRSTNFGETWVTLGAANGITTSARTLVAVSPANPQVVYAVQANGNVFGRMYRSDDGGNTFITTVIGDPAAGTNFFGYETNGRGTTGQAGYDMAMTVNPNNANEVHIAGIICWKSTDGGYSFVPTTAWSLPNSVGYNHADVHVLEWLGNTIYSGSDGGIYKSTNYAEDWVDLTSGLGIRQFYKIAISATNPELVTGGAQDNGSSILKANGWIDWLGADGMDCVVSPLDANIIWGTSQNGGIYRTDNGGLSYRGLPRPNEGNWVTPLAQEPNSNVIYGGWQGVYKSTDLGASWTKLSGNTITAKLSVLAVAPSNPQYIYASTGPVLYVTTDGGTNWTTYSLTSINISSITVHPTIPTKIWITNTNSASPVLVSTNAGSSFTNFSNGLPTMAARSIAIDDTPEGGLYVAMNIGVYYINTKMSSWLNLTKNLPLVAINDIELQKLTRKIRIATYGRGVWEGAMFNACGTPGYVEASIQASGSTSLCEGSSVTLTASSASSYLWSNGATTQSIVVNQSGNYAVTLTNIIGCSATSAPIQVTVNPYPTASITNLGSKTISVNQTATLRANAGVNFTYQWFKNGTLINGASSSSYIANTAGRYTVQVANSFGCSILSAVEELTFMLPANNFNVQLVGETCRTSDNGKVSISAIQNLNYTATLTRAGQTVKTANFNTTAELSGLAAGNYSLCITVAEQTDYKQCYDILITEPQDLSVNSEINLVNNTVQLNMSGSDSYVVNLNGKNYTSTSSVMSLALQAGLNKITVSSGKECQSTYTEEIYLSELVEVYPNPFNSILNIKIKNQESKSLNVKILNGAGALMYEGVNMVQNNLVSLDLTKLENGYYFVVIGKEKFKVIKK